MVKKRRPKLKSQTRWQKFTTAIRKAWKPYQPYRHQIRYGILITAFALTWYWNPELITSIQDSTLAGIDNTTGFLRALYAKLDEMLGAIIALIALWAVWIHRKDKKNGN